MEKISEAEFTAAIGQAIAEIFRRKWLRYANGAWRSDTAAMVRYAETQAVMGKGAKWRLVRSMTPQQYEMLRLVKPDGMTDWQHNTDFLKHLEKTDEFGFLKQFPLNSVDPKELGYKEKKDETPQLLPVNPHVRR